MENDLKIEIEKLKKEMGELRSLFLQFTGQTAKNDPKRESERLKKLHPMKNMNLNPGLSKIMDSPLSQVLLLPRTENVLRACGQSVKKSEGGGRQNYPGYHKSDG